MTKPECATKLVDYSEEGNGSRTVNHPGLKAEAYHKPEIDQGAGEIRQTRVA